MIIANIILITSMIVWALTTFRQYKTNFFHFFLIFALMDPIALVFRLLTPVYPIRIYGILIPIIIISLINFRRTAKNYLILSIIVLINAFVSLYAAPGLLMVQLTLLHSIIFFIIMKISVTDVLKNKKLNLFYFVLALYEFSKIAKYIILLNELKTGIIYFNLTGLFEILIGVYFIFYNEKNAAKYKMNLNYK
ncbi:MAG: hypothetical protein M1480_18490 [Bacteroidetes bacterium]|nr:hypothetical protein [Bacteroidota bacterium]